MLEPTVGWHAFKARWQIRRSGTAAGLESMFRTLACFRGPSPARTQPGPAGLESMGTRPHGFADQNRVHRPVGSAVRTIAGTSGPHASAVPLEFCLVFARRCYNVGDGCWLGSIRSAGLFENSGANRRGAPETSRPAPIACSRSKRTRSCPLPPCGGGLGGGAFRRAALVAATTTVPHKGERVKRAWPMALLKTAGTTGKGSETGCANPQPSCVNPKPSCANP